MALLKRIPAFHTVAEFRRAARLRYAEAGRAVEAGDRLLAVYLVGYSAEMTVKAAYFRVINKAADEPIDFADLQAAKSRYRALTASNWPGNLHNQVAWGDLVVAERQSGGAPVPGPLAKLLAVQVQRLAANWREVLRYHGNRPRPEEVAAVFEAAGWLFAQESRLIK